MAPTKRKSSGRPKLARRIRAASEGKRAEIALRESEDRYRKLIDLSPDAIFVHSDWRVVLVNQAMLRLFRVGSAAQLLGREVLELVAPESRENVRARIATMYEERLTVPPAEIAYMRADGSRFSAEVTAGAFSYAGRPGAQVVARDITERKLTEAALQQSEERFRSLTELSSDWYWEQDEELRLSFHSSGFDLSSGTKSAQLLGKRRWEEPDRLPLSCTWDEHRATLEARKPFRNFEYVRIGDKGKRTYVSLSGEPVFDAQGEFRGYRGVGTNITERKQVEQALRASLDETDAILRTSTVGIMFVRERKFVRCNARLEEMFGYSPGELTGKPTRMLYVSEEEWLRVAKETYPAMSAGQIGHAEIAGLSKSGRKIWTVLTGKYIDPQRPELGAVFSATDVTERRRLDAELRAAEEQFRGLVEQSIAGIYIIQDGKLAYVNPRCAEIFGYGSAVELVGRDSISMVVEKERAAVLDKHGQLEGGASSLSYGFTALRKDGSTIEVGAHSARATHRGRPAIIGLMQDISEKNRAEEEIRRYTEQLKTAFMSSVEVATAMSEMRDPYTAGHQRRVAEIAVAIGAELGLDSHQQEGLQVAGQLHDIGKITIPSEILSKPGKLSQTEFRLIKEHAQASFDVLKGVEFPWPVAQIALQHHERMDGSGYPQGLKGEAILLEARIMAVADVVEAMTSHRPYRPGFGIEKALAEIERGGGSLYDAVVVDACLKLFRQKAYAIPE